MEIGEKIKNLRTILGLTQEELAERAELTKGFISQLERGLTSPSISSLEDVLEALGTNLSDFFKEEKEDRVVFKKTDAFETIFENGKSTLEWIVPNAQKNSMEPIIITLNEKGSFSRTYEPFEGEEFGYVIKGKVEFRFGSKIFVLKEGECFYTSGNNERSIVNVSKKESKVLWVTNPPNF
ncbi:MAG: helix-turn-helix domain-containing protein [Peptoniphilaceae bacterium]|uniref:helix-turn-helix domain-containing protein n=1 Tax=Parvimonas sp. TaxID=1944660 RepID=UPI0025E34782|nr:helix-turn-helix domain-containing protein [Parvimonas sp.]MCI5997278.1 helix-turn-helix domain-containing protein [Parvimonas sp.]MDD7765448.1 helix-turn-helix domain-containing protein [Peptoniphilaceae bacterium]MDY3050989.1 helix-turn-helix domain-containing protein [Parvimonas sp.]